jgi:pyruvate dehydrogenase E2 component (dihydrolipoamide acetyltransferase)
MNAITAVKMPKWGLSMDEGTVIHWWKSPGERVTEGDDLLDVETSKITNAVAAPVSGVLRRIVAAPDGTLPVGALLAVIADDLVSNDEIERFVDAFQAGFVHKAPEAQTPDSLALQTVQAGSSVLRIGKTTGSGVPIVLLHGFGADLNNWLFNVEALSAVGPVIAIDLPGHGASSKDVADGSLHYLSSAVGSALDALGETSVNLVGHSLGAAIAMRLALDRPDLARSLTLIAPAGLPGSEVSRDFLNDFVEAERTRDLRPVLEKLVADPALISRDMINDVLKFKRLDGAQEALAALRERIIEGSDFHALQSRLSELPSALVIASHDDAIIKGLDSATLPAGWRVAWIEGAGHMVHLEQAAAVNELILSVIRV